MSGLVAKTADKRINPWLDLVRSLAIVLVLLRHGQVALQTNSAAAAPTSFIQTVFMNGWIGVDLFFVLSGYLIARHLLRSGIGSGEFQFGRYLALRVLRIVPAYYAVLILVALGLFPFFPVAPDLLAVRVTYHLLFLQDYLPSNINVVFWSLGVEEKFYLLAPVLMFALLALRNNAARAAVLIVLFAIPGVVRTSMFTSLNEPINYTAYFQMFRSPFHLALEPLVVGVAIGLAQHLGYLVHARRVGLVTLAAVTVLFVAVLGSHDFMAQITIWDATLQPSVIALLTGALTLAAVQLGGTPMPMRRPFQLVSRSSYSLYLIHFPLIPLCLTLGRAHGPAVFWGAYLISSAIAATLLHVAIERPFLVWKDYLARAEPTATRVHLPAH